MRKKNYFLPAVLLVTTGIFGQQPGPSRAQPSASFSLGQFADIWSFSLNQFNQASQTAQSINHANFFKQREQSVVSPAKILVVSHDPTLADVRKILLERAGFKVIAATSDSKIGDICRRKKPHLVMIGHSLAPAAKRRVGDEARKVCKVPILKLYQNKSPELMPPAFFHEAQAPDDFLMAVQKILKN